MKLSTDIKPITYMKTHSSDLVKELNNKKQPIVITQNGIPKAILMDIKTYEKQRDAIMLLKLIAQGEKDIKEKRTIIQDDLFARLDKKLKIKQKS